MLGWDRHLERWQAAHRTGALDRVFEALTHAGSYGALWLVLAACAAALLRRPQVFLWTLVADGVGELAADALKGAIPRARPGVPALVHRPHTHSFPSGHATTSFACATVLGAFAPRLRAPLLVLAAAVAWSRAYVGVHYPLDVIAGALLGAAIGAALLRALPRLAAARPRSRRATPAG